MVTAINCPQFGELLQDYLKLVLVYTFQWTQTCTFNYLLHLQHTTCASCCTRQQTLVQDSESVQGVSAPTSVTYERHLRVSPMSVTYERHL